MKDEACIAFLQWALPRLGLRWPGFRRVRGQVCKRVSRRAAELGLADVGAYRAYLEADPEEWARLDRFCFISVSRFFRDRGLFECVGDEILPRLAAAARERGAGAVRAWSAGCASGEEPYSLALVWRFAVAAGFPDLAFQVVATDADPGLLDRARRACYGAGSLKDLPAPWRERAFARRGALWCLREGGREGVAFHLQDLRRERPEGRFDLVLCRNLAFTYFEDTLQRQVLARLTAALRPGGALVLGRHERLPEDASGLTPWSTASVYRRTPEAGGGASP
jgi:chemotaxis protein methyltransferase CheR